MFEGWDLPPPDVLEVSIFGRGNGESIVLHYGDGHWAVIDSLKSDNQPIALTYLQALGVKIESDLKLAIVSHWHDDHIKGMAEIVGQATSAICAIPLPMLDDRFLAFAQMMAGGQNEVIGSGVEEYYNIIKLMEKRKWINYKLLTSFKNIIRHSADDLAHGMPIEIESLSPSDFDVHRFLERIANYVVPKDVAIRSPKFSENDISVAVQVRVGKISAAFGADLEVTSDARSGWDAVFASKQLTGEPAGLIKISHHGSKTGHHPSIWTALCAANPIASLTQWSRGGRRLPTQDDVARIRALSSESYAATRSLTSGDRHRLKSVNSVLKKGKSRVRPLDLRLGHIRHRFIDGAWRTNLFGAAVELKNVNA